VYVDGQEVAMKLPALGKGSMMTFASEVLPSGRVRVSVQVEQKEVTLDWSQAAPPGDQYFFALRFSHEDWKVGVE
jgi:hypothetical protein